MREPKKVEKKFIAMRVKPFALWGIRGLSTSSTPLAMATPTLTHTSNPVLADWSSTFGLPPFASIEPEHFRPAFDVALAAHRSEVRAIATNTQAATFDNTIAALDKAGSLKNKVRALPHTHILDTSLQSPTTLYSPMNPLILTPPHPRPGQP
jgi:hypothetical protein